MRKMTFFTLIGALLLVSGSALGAFFDMAPGSVLIFPFYSSDPGKETIINVTNINVDPIYDPELGEQFGSIYLHYFYIDGEDCDITDRREFLTPGDTLSVIASIHNPAFNEGWLYVVAENQAGQPYLRREIEVRIVGVLPSKSWIIDRIGPVIRSPADTKHRVVGDDGGSGAKDLQSFCSRALRVCSR